MSETKLHVVAEHHNFAESVRLSVDDYPVLPKDIFFLGNTEGATCVNITDTRCLKTGYFIGLDWLTKEKAIYVEPKFNKEGREINFVQMLFDALKHPDIIAHTGQLYEIKWNDKPIQIKHRNDMLSPLLVVHFLRVVKDIVRKGLKKSYYKIEENLYGRIKGKVLVSQTVKHNIAQSKSLHNVCVYEQFGLNNPENRLIKKTLTFVQRVLNQYSEKQYGTKVNSVFNYIMPAFATVSEEIDLKTVKQFKVNPLYKEYREAVRLAKLILKRFGYSLTNIDKLQQETISTPPFWIDMSRLFELYVLGLLKDRFGNTIEYHFTSNRQELDFLLNSPEYKMVIDAKYKERYNKEYPDNVKEDIRQLSGYARMTKVYDSLKMDKEKRIDCLIIYPNQDKEIIDLADIDLRNEEAPIRGYEGIYKLGVKMPEIKSKH